jgi:hypothetical protein
MSIPTALENGVDVDDYLQTKMEKPGRIPESGEVKNNVDRKTSGIRRSPESNESRVPKERAGVREINRDQSSIDEVKRFNVGSTIPVFDESGSEIGKTVESQASERIIPEESIINNADSVEVHEYSEELEEGANVWGKLADHFEGDQNKTGNTILKFQKGIAKQLVVEYDMTADQAKSFIDWRFRNMDVGEGFKLDQSGDLQIDRFAEQNEIERFANSSMGKNLGISELLAGDIDEPIDVNETGDSPIGGEEGARNDDLGYNVVEADGTSPRLEKMVNIFQNRKITPDVWNSMTSVKIKDILKIPIEDEELKEFIKSPNNLSEIKSDLKIPADSSIGNINEKKFEEIVKIAKMVREETGIKNLNNINATVGEFLVKHIDKIK